MIVRSTAATLAGVVFLAACAGTANRAGTATHWHTKVYRGIGGEAAAGEQKSIAHTSMTKLNETSARASVTLPGLLPQGTYEWGVFQGSCDAMGALMGDASDYPVIDPDANSMGSFTANINDSLDAGQTYSLAIFTDNGGRDDVLGCNVLRIGTADDDPE